MGENQRERQTPRRAGSPMRDPIPGLRDHDPSRRQSPNRLSHPGAPALSYLLIWQSERAPPSGGSGEPTTAWGGGGSGFGGQSFGSGRWRVPESDGGDGCATAQTSLRLRSWAPSTGSDGKCYAFYRNKSRVIKEKPSRAALRQRDVRRTRGRAAGSRLADTRGRSDSSVSAAENRTRARGRQRCGTGRHWGRSCWVFSKDHHPELQSCDVPAERRDRVSVERVVGGLRPTRGLGGVACLRSRRPQRLCSFCWAPPCRPSLCVPAEPRRSLTTCAAPASRSGRETDLGLSTGFRRWGRLPSRLSRARLRRVSGGTPKALPPNCFKAQTSARAVGRRKKASRLDRSSKTLCSERSPPYCRKP
ncbi:uncharacterized protein LOC135362275 [Mirounga angustirostris]|uniref:uncharacterized protein LOC135362275 n=1 Tax=Mirounga angustirostris TaxID=9716 RepID=UPI00313B8514